MELGNLPAVERNPGQDQRGLYLQRDKSADMRPVRELRQRRNDRRVRRAVPGCRQATGSGGAGNMKRERRERGWRVEAAVRSGHAGPVRGPLLVIRWMRLGRVRGEDHEQ